jgi:DNA-binding transcriptional regulator GbsR (MarR family)
MSTLAENLNPKDYKNLINLELKKEALSEDEKNRLIIDIFQKIKKNTGKDPSILSIVKALKDYKIGYKTCERILKTNNFVQQNIISQHLSQDLQEKIKKEFNKLNPSLGKIQETYKSLAKKHNVTKGQVQDLLKDRTFESKRKKEIQNNFDEIVKAYHNLSDEQKRKPIHHIEKIVPLAKPAISNHLKKSRSLSIK